MMKRWNGLFHRSGVVGVFTLFHIARRRVHERVGSPASRPMEERVEAARNALLQFNVMVGQGVEPDVLMYTSLISIMGKARMEWQAYKLFSRMLEQGLQPVPETYLALRMATSTARKKLISDIECKMRECIQQLPQELAKEEVRRQALDAAQRQERITAAEANPHLPTPTAIRAPQCREPQSPSPQDDDASYSTVHIDSPQGAWATFKAMQQRQGLSKSLADNEARDALRPKLEKLHEEELRIYLTVHRQLRDGNKSDLINRVLGCVPQSEIEEMLIRRKRYFGAVREMLERQLSDSAVPDSTPLTADQAALHHSDGGTASPSELELPPDSSSGAEPQKDVSEQKSPNELSTRDVFTSAPEFLHAPWGIIKKPLNPPPRSPSIVNETSNDPLSQEELLELHAKAAIGEIDLVPQHWLRRYCRQFHLKWKRRVSGELVDLVRWHIKHFPPNGASSQPAFQERVALGETLDAFHALQLISRRCHNLQVVDAHEVASNVASHLKKENRAKKLCDDAMRRERNLAAAEALQQAATEYTPPLREEPKPSRVLGIVSHTETANSGSQELPPWALTLGRSPFHFKNGTFGDPERGQLTEVSEGKFRLRPNFEAQQKWQVDVDALPAEMQKRLRENILTREASEALQNEQSENEKRTNARSQRFANFVRRARRRAEEAKSATLKPLPPRLRMAQMLTAARHQPRMKRDTNADSPPTSSAETDDAERVKGAS